MLNIGTVLQNRYEIMGIIGKGGMSTVYQARSLQDGRLLAVKDVSRSATGGNQIVEQSLSAEGRMLMQLSNPHLPKIYNIIENDANIILIMDYVDGESLDKVIAKNGPQSMDKVLDWGMQICSVFTYLHSQPTPIIYRDMKPANVMVDAGGRIMMIDFGTARTEKIGVEMQEDTICIGTVGFAAPEQYGGYGQSTAQTDIFCLGATLYNMITGHSPCEPPAGILPLERWNSALAKTPLAKIIYKCTKNDPAERYQSAAELFQDLNLARNGVPQKSNQYIYNVAVTADSWQKQEFKQAGRTGGLSGLLKRYPAEKKQDTRNSADKWQIQNSPQTPMQVPVPAQISAPMQTPVFCEERNTWQNNSGYDYPAQQENPVELPRQAPENSDNWKILTVISAVLAALFVVLGVILLIMEQTLISLVLLIVAAGAVVLALTGIILSRMNPVY